MTARAAQQKSIPQGSHDPPHCPGPDSFPGDDITTNNLNHTRARAATTEKESGELHQYIVKQSPCAIDQEKQDVETRSGAAAMTWPSESEWSEIYLRVINAPSLVELEHALDGVLRGLDVVQAWRLEPDGDERAACPTAARLPAGTDGLRPLWLSLDCATDQPLDPARQQHVSRLATVAGSVLQRIFAEIRAIGYSAELTWIHSFMGHDPQASSLMTTPAQELQRRLGLSSSQALIGNPQSPTPIWSFAARRRAIALSPAQQQRLLRVANTVFDACRDTQRRLHLLPPAEAERLAQEYRLPELGRLGQIAIVPIQRDGAFHGALILGDERGPDRQRFSPVILHAALLLADMIGEMLQRARRLGVAINHGPLLQALIDNLEEGLLTTEQGVITSWNRAACLLFGYEGSEVIGRRVEAVLPGAPPGLLAARRAAEIPDTPGHTFEWRMTTADGRDILLSCAVSGIHAPARRNPIVMFVFRSVSPEREIEAWKDDLLSGISHELRTPLNGIVGFSSMLLTRPTLSAQRRQEALETLHDASLHLNRMVDDFILVARARRGQLPIHLEPTDVRSLLRDILLDLRRRHAEHPIHLRVDRALPRVQADGLRLRQIMENLVSNAAKYSEPGTPITIAARRGADDVQISVRDRGSGIPEALLPQIFEPFVRADHSLTQRSSGLGLGLSIVKTLIQAHGGKIRVRSTVGKGSTFTCSLPILALDADEEPP
jgi:PAS domain S-box-containing protein